VIKLKEKFSKPKIVAKGVQKQNVMNVCKRAGCQGR